MCLEPWRFATRYVSALRTLMLSIMSTAGPGSLDASPKCVKAYVALQRLCGPYMYIYIHCHMYVSIYVSLSLYIYVYISYRKYHRITGTVHCAGDRCRAAAPSFEVALTETVPVSRHIYIQMHVCTYIHIYVYIDICVYMYIYIYTYVLGEL